MNNGLISSYKSTRECVKEYLYRNYETTKLLKVHSPVANDYLKINSIEFDEYDKKVVFHFEVLNEVGDLRFGIEILDSDNYRKLISSYHDDTSASKSLFNKGVYEIELTLRDLFLKEGGYLLKPVVTIHNDRMLYDPDYHWEFKYDNALEINKAYKTTRDSDLILPLPYKIIN